MLDEGRRQRSGKEERRRIRIQQMAHPREGGFTERKINLQNTALSEMIPFCISRFQSLQLLQLTRYPTRVH